MSANVAEAFAKRSDSSAEQLTPLAGISRPIDRLLARHPNASAPMLETLLHTCDKSTRKNLTLNANPLKEVLLLQKATTWRGSDD